VTYTYDGDGMRVKKSSGTLYWGAGPMLESDLSGNFQREYVFAGGARIARRDISTGNAYYFLNDRLGSLAVIANSAGAIQNEYDYLPYGEERDYSTTLANQNFKFIGKERDSESGLDNFGARFDASTLGRFMTPDWSAVPVDVPYAQLANPQSLNLYAYVMNSPVTTADLDGHQQDIGQIGSDVDLTSSDLGNKCTSGRTKENDARAAEAGVASSAFLQYVKGEAAGTVEYGKKVFDLLSTLPYVGPFFGVGSAAVSASQGNTGEATTSTALAVLSAAPGAGEVKGAELLKDGETLTRLGTDAESAARLGRKALEAEEKIGIHGVSTTAAKIEGKEVSTAARSAVERSFKVHNTPTRVDPLHRTVELPKPVTKSTADIFNALFGR